MSAPEPHPLSELFPMLPDDELGELADDICTFGLRKKIVLFDGKVLDGRNRLAACEMAGVEPEFETYGGKEPLFYVLSHNLHRRHLSESQRAMIAAKIVDWDFGLNQHTADCANLPTRKAAQALSISERAVTSAKRIRERGDAALIEAIQDGRISVHAGEALTDLEHAAQREVIEREEKAIIAQAKEIRTRRMAASRQARLTKLAAIASNNEAVLKALPRNAFPVLYCDYPWPNDVYDEETGQDKGYPYPPMPLDEGRALCVGDRSPATKDAVMFFWTTGNRIGVAIDMIRAWGFDDKSSIVWDKITIGNGRWVRDRHEILIIATRGKVPAPLMGTQEESLFSEKKGEHSAKPVRVRRMIERLYPDLPKLEMFARGEIPGWSVWGNQAEGGG